VFQNRIHLSAVPPPDASRPCWCGDHAMAFTAAVCSANRIAGVSLFSSQMQSWLSLPPDASCRLSGDHFRPQTSERCVVHLQQAPAFFKSISHEHTSPQYSYFSNPRTLQRIRKTHLQTTVDLPAFVHPGGRQCYGAVVESPIIRGIAWIPAYGLCDIFVSIHGNKTISGEDSFAASLTHTVSHMRTLSTDQCTLGPHACVLA
jgi:hypothetical protein